MPNIALHVDHLSKRYRIGLREEQHETLFGAALSWLSSPGANFRRLRKLSTFDDGEADGDVIWALDGVSFKVEQGEVVGIIGHNGAGKTTLLKILSRITEPTGGWARIQGRVSSLLEVGTGFHPELTGRENVFLNGTVLGMSKGEVERKFDEIVAFSGVEKFIDTPVKRYSSGMKVRLAFSVAAHLEPEVLLIDEVLAVGDAAFQQKCLGKMGAVAREGRTVLFVSHDMAAVQNLCPRCILLDSGRVAVDGATPTVIEQYLDTILTHSAVQLGERTDRRGQGDLRFSHIELLNQQGKRIEQALSGEPLLVRLHYLAKNGTIFRHCRASIAVYSHTKPYFLTSTDLVHTDEIVLKGQGYLDCIVDELPLSKGDYYLEVHLESNKVVQDWVNGAAKLTVIDGNFFGSGRNYPKGWEGKTVLVKHRWLWQ